jgi:hypothetical protein
VTKVQKIDRLTIHRMADTITAKKYDKNAEFGITGEAFSNWAFEYANGNEELERKLFDEQDEMTGLMYDLVRKYGVEVVEEL